MTQIKISTLVWDEWNIKHIRKHSVCREEVEVAVNNICAHKKGYKRRLMLIGRSGKRILALILAREKMGNYYVVTARDADKKERRLVYEKENC